MKIKRMMAFLIALTCLLSCFGCAAKQGADTSTAPTVSSAAKEKLDGKKILFVGNSYFYYGHAVLRSGTDVLTQAQREHDEGYFYQLCKAMGAEVAVTDWSFGDHSLWESLGNSCTRKTCYGVDHLSYLTDRYFDYVAFTPYEKDHSGDMLAYLQPMMDIFREANPDVKFILAVPHGAYANEYAWIPGLPQIDQSQIAVCNWGKMLTDILDGTVQVPNATQQYFKNSFIVSISEADGHHQNVLSGYLTALMVYCAITGDSAVDLPYDFCSDTSIRTEFNLDAYKQDKYTYDTYTNFIEIFRSPADMNGLQQLVDRYIAAPFGS